MLDKQIVHRQQVDEFGNINVQTVTQIVEDGKIISEAYHRHVVAPGDVTIDEDAVTKEIAKVVHTPEVIAAYEARKTEAQLNG